MRALRELQGSFWRALHEQAPSPELLDAVRDAPPLATRDRVRIYTDAYRWRLTDALREDFPRLADHLGAATFCALAGDYVAAHPSAHPSIAEAGARLADFVRGRPGVPAWAGDLARLEWARRTVLTEADAAPLDLAAVRALPPAAWAELPLVAVPACRTLVAGSAVHRAWEDGGGTPPAARTAYRVWRQGFRVYHAVMTAAEEAAVARLVRGTTFGAVCEEMAGAEEAGRLLLRWLDDGLVRAPA